MPNKLIANKLLFPFAIYAIQLKVLDIYRYIFFFKNHKNDQKSAKIPKKFGVFSSESMLALVSR